MKNSTRMICAASVLLASCSASWTALGQCRPSQGCASPALAGLDAVVLDFMCQRNIGAASVALVRNRQLVYERSFGWSDAARTEPLMPDALMRIASVSKPITVSAVRELITEGAFTLDSKVFDVGQPGGGLLRAEPFPSLGDPRLADVTVRHLIEHAGGWNRDIAGDLTYREIVIAEAMGVPSPPGRLNTVRWILGQPLQFAPGSGSNYSNIGCLVLGLIVEQRRGLPLEEVLDGMMARAGVADADHGMGRTFRADQDPREPHYEATGLGRNVFDPAGPWVNQPYGTWDHEARAGQGGQVATAAALARFAAHYYVNGTNIGRPRPASDPGTWRWNHTGSLVGTSSLIRQRGDGISYAVIFNKRSSSEDYGAAIRTAIDAYLDAGSVAWGSVWPLCPADWNCDGTAEFNDLLEFLNDQTSSSPRADLNRDGTVDFNDLLEFLNRYNAGC